MAGRSRTLTYGLPSVGAVALAAGVFLVVSNRPVATAEPPPRAPVAAPDASGDAPPLPGDGGAAAGLSGEAAGFIGAIGVSEPPGEAIAVAAQRSGVVTSVSVSVGDEVAAGDPLFAVESRPAERAVALAEAEVAVAEAEVATLLGRIPTREAAVKAAEAQLEAAAADRNDAANRLKVAESVTDKRAIAAQEVDERRFAAQSAEARVAAAEADRASALAELRLLEEEDGGGGPELRVARSRAEQARARLADAQTELDLLTVRAPVDAEVLQVNTRPGEFAPASASAEALVVLGRVGPGHVRVEVDEVDVPRFERDARAWASPRGAAERRVELEFVYVEPLLVPKQNLSGRTSELIDTRVMEVVYRLPEGFASPGYGQQFDVYIQAGEAK